MIKHVDSYPSIILWNYSWTLIFIPCSPPISTLEELYWDVDLDIWEELYNDRDVDLDIWEELYNDRDVDLDIWEELYNDRDVDLDIWEELFNDRDVDLDIWEELFTDRDVDDTKLRFKKNDI